MSVDRLPPLSQLRAFCAYAETGALAKAGAALNVSHAAISQHIRNLEEHLGVTLLDRSGRKAELTPEGRLLAEALGRGFSVMAEAVDALTGAEDARPIHVTTTPSFAAHWLLPRLPDFRLTHPDVDIVIDANSAVIDPAPGGVDVAVRYGAGHWAGMEAVRLLESELVLVAAPALVADRVIDAPAALADLPWLSELGRNESTDWLMKHGVTEKRGSVTQLPGSMAIEAARQGQGVLPTARSWVEADLRSGRLQLLFSEPEGGGYYIVTRPGVMRPAARDFCRWLRRQV